MTCARCREALSARLDGEETGMEAAAIAAHLDRCSSCRLFASQSALVNKATRVIPAESVPDLTPSIMAALTVQPLERPSTSPAIVRWALALVAVAQLVLAVPALLGDDAGAPIHIAREQGSWSLALAVALLVVAYRPAEATGIVVLVGVLVACLIATMGVDIIAGRTVAASEAPHMLAILGFGLLWLVAHPDTLGRRLPGRPSPA